MDREFVKQVVGEVLESWDEGKHPRGKDGKFSSGSGEGGKESQKAADQRVLHGYVRPGNLVTKEANKKIKEERKARVGKEEAEKKIQKSREHSARAMDASAKSNALKRGHKDFWRAHKIAAYEHGLAADYAKAAGKPKAERQHRQMEKEHLDVRE